VTQHTAWLYYLASALIAKGADIKTVQARMRHASARTTLDTLDRLELPIEQIGRSLPLKLFTADPDTGPSRRRQ
jgi:integrase